MLGDERSLVSLGNGMVSLSNSLEPIFGPIKVLLCKGSCKVSTSYHY